MKNWLFKIALQFITGMIYANHTQLTKDYLITKGFVPHKQDSAGRIFWTQENIKERDKIWITFENHYYRVWHGKDCTFIALQSSQEWFDIYYSLLKDRL